LRFQAAGILLPFFASPIYGLSSDSAHSSFSPSIMAFAQVLQAKRLAFQGDASLWGIVTKR